MDKNRVCGIVQDLLPSYLEGLTNDTTNEMINEHMEACEICREYKESLRVSNEQLVHSEESISRGFKKKLSRYRYQLLGLFLGVILTVGGVLGSFILSITYLRAQLNTSSHTEEIGEYREFKDYYGLSKLYLFPKASVTEEGDVSINKYIYDCHGNKAYQTCQIYLECEYSGNAFEDEKKRFMEIKNSKTKLTVKYDSEEFRYPAFYAMKGSEGCYEYVLLLEEEKKMIYVYLQGGVDRRELLFSEEYLPLEYGQTGYNFEEEGYSIYHMADLFMEEE